MRAHLQVPPLGPRPTAGCPAQVPRCGAPPARQHARWSRLRGVPWRDATRTGRTGRRNHFAPHVAGHTESPLYYSAEHAAATARWRGVIRTCHGRGGAERGKQRRSRPRSPLLGVLRSPSLLPCRGFAPPTHRFPPPRRPRWDATAPQRRAGAPRRGALRPGRVPHSPAALVAFSGHGASLASHLSTRTSARVPAPLWRAPPHSCCLGPPPCPAAHRGGGRVTGRRLDPHTPTPYRRGIRRAPGPARAVISRNRAPPRLERPSAPLLCCATPCRPAAG